MKNKSPICIIGGYDALSKSFFKDLKKRHELVLFINLLASKYYAKDLYNFKIFELSDILSLLNIKGIKDVIFLGKINRPDLKTFKNDGVVENYIPLLLAAYKNGDGAVLNAVIDIFKDNNLRTVFPLKYSNSFSLDKDDMYGDLTKDNHIDITKSSNLLNQLSKFDNAQSIVSINGYITAIEAVEGTDSMLRRVWKIRKSLNQLSDKSGFLIKKPKKNQSKFIDLPVIGPKTIKLIKKANLKGLAINRKYTMVHNKDEVLQLIEKHDLKIYNIE